MEQGIYKPEIPEYLRWTYGKDVLPAEFHQMDLPTFENLLDTLAVCTLVSGVVSHGTALAFGLIYRDIQRAVFLEPGHSDEITSSFTNSYYDAFHQRLTSLYQMTKAQQQQEPEDPKSFGKPLLLQNSSSGPDNIIPPQRPPSAPLAFLESFPPSKPEQGRFFVPDPPLPWAGEDGSPGNLPYERHILAGFLNGLSPLEVYQHAGAEVDLVRQIHCIYFTQFIFYSDRLNSSKSLGTSQHPSVSRGSAQLTMLALSFMSLRMA